MLPHKNLEQRFMLFWGITLLILTACSRVPEVDLSTPPPTPTRNPTIPVETPAKLILSPTANLMMLPTADFSALPPLPPGGQGSRPAIEQFEVSVVEDVSNGKQISLSWKSEGMSARLIAGTQSIAPPWWNLPPSGQLTITLAESMFPNPPLMLQVFDAVEPTAITSFSEATIDLEWPCSFAYFFEPVPAPCPAEAAVTGPAAEQPFENGVMIWIEELDSVFVLSRADQRWRRYEDTWSEDQPESDPTIIPPAGRYQPIRGFGKVWREQPDVRAQLGWALGPELGFESTIQNQWIEPDENPILFVLTFNGQVFALIQRQPNQGEWVIATS